MMNRPPQGRGQPRLGATWYPGGQDDFYMPEVISPSPQRVMPEVPQTMQHNIAHLEREARNQHQHRSQYGLVQHDRPQYPPRTASASASASASVVHGSPHPASYDASPYEQSVVYDNMDQSNFSSFPVLRNPPPNVPPTDEQREASLETSRMAVLSSNDPEMQLSWAQDALVHVEIIMQNEARLALVQPPRPQTPPVERQMKNDAMSIVRFLADQFHPKAEFIRGMWLEFGKFGFPVDKREAFRAYTRAAEKGYARAEYRIGMQFESAGEPEKGVRHYNKGVALGDSASYYRLGMMMLLGQHGHPQDYQTGLEYIHLAAESCDENAPQGAFVYGMLLARELAQVTVPEQFLPLDLNAARINVEKAAFHGFAKAQVKMGAAYELCQLGCDFNPALSLHYNALAARQGEAEAEMAISKWFLCGHEGVFEKNDEMAFNYAQRAAQSGFPTAEFALGYFYEVGIFVPVDIKEARSWYSKAAASGNKDANNRIDSISRSKTLSKKDHEKVAIARIKSRRGGNSLGKMPENMEMPDPSKMSLSDNPGSTAPYPQDKPRARPPYPDYAEDPRPSSAFGINPNIRANAPNYHRAASYGPGPMGYRQANGSKQPGGPGSPPHMRSPPGTPKLDIGFSAPMESPAADSRRRPPRLDGPPDRKPARTPVSAPMSSPRPAVGSPSAASFASAPAPQKESKPSTPKPPASNPAGQKPGGGGAAPSKGPKTFEEMGVPTVRKDNDCIVM